MKPLPRLLPALLALALAAPAAAGPAPLIPRDLLFGPFERGNPQLSADGTRMIYRARAGAGSEIRLRTFATGEDVRLGPDPGRFSWSPDGTRLLSIRDRDGDENWHLWSLDPGSGAEQDLTPYPGSRVEDVLTDPRHPQEVLVGLNLRDPRLSDMHRVNLATGAVTLDTENPGDVISWSTDAHFVIRGATALDSVDGSTVLRVRDRKDAPWREIARWSFEQAGNDRYRRILGFTPDGEGLVVQSPTANTTRLVILSARTGAETTVLAEDPRADVWNLLDVASSVTEVAALFDSTGARPLAVAFEHLEPGWKVLDPALAKDFAALRRLHRGSLVLQSRDAADRRWIVEYVLDDGPPVFYLYDRASRKATLLFTGHDGLARQKLARMKPLTFRARDGLEIPAYLTLPVGVPAKHLPLVLLVHGGPWWRDSHVYQPDVQWLANRGYAVLQVNFRGSTGFGRAFLNAGSGGIGTGSMQHDVTDAARWAIAQGIADPRRIGIMGYSYGGFATLAGLAFTPELYACGVEMCGPSNMKSLIESFPPYWAPRKRRWLLRVGDVIADDALNRRISPLFHVDRIRSPLLVAHGANDPRVKLAESEQVVRAVRDSGVPVTLIVYPDEGHGLNRPENNLDFYARAEEFLAKHLGGRVEPMHEVKGATAEVR